jgi:hypothetical protein
MFDDYSVTPTPMVPGIPLNEQTVNAAEVMALCHYLGKQLRSLSPKQRELAISQLLTKGDSLADASFTFGAMMFRTVARGCKDLG